MTFDDFIKRNSSEESKIEIEKSENIKKILKDNLFQEKFIFPSRVVNGLICFPISMLNERIIEINIPGVEIHQRQKMDLNIKL